MDKNVETITVVTFNVRGLRDTAKRKQIFLFLKKLNYQLVCLQETHSTIDEEIEWKKQWGGEILFSHGTSTARGVMTLLRLAAVAKMHKLDSSSNGRYLIAEIEIKDTLFFLGNIYAPNEDDPALIRQIFEYVDQSECTDVCFCGDFNMVLNIDLDRWQSKYNNVRAAEAIKGCMENGFCDYWRCCNPDKREYTWFRSRTNVKQRQCARLDYFLVSDQMCTRIENIKHKPGIFSDHSMVVMEIRSNLPKRGKGLWKMNSKHLMKDSFVKELSKLIQKASYKYWDCTPALKWEMVKTEVVSACQLYSRQASINVKNAIEQLQRTIKYLEDQCVVTQQQKFSDELVLVRAEMERFTVDLKEKYAFCSRARYYGEGEKSTKYFFNLAKARYCNRVTYEVEEGGVKISNPNDVLDIQYRFYHKLYTSNGKVKFELTNTKGVKISRDDYE